MLLEARNLDFFYERDLVLENINLTINSGDFLAIIGPNGGGKSTLAKLLLRLLAPKNGEIFYGKPSLKIGYVPQNTNLNTAFPLSAMDVVLMGQYRPKLFGFHPRRSDYKNAETIMESLNIAHLSGRLIAELSGGERQKVLIARALMGDPELLILDEPTSNIDAPSQKSIYNLLQELNTRRTIVVISHDIAVILGYATRVLYVNRQSHAHEVSPTALSIEDSHICEVDILELFNKCLRDHAER